MQAVEESRIADAGLRCAVLVVAKAHRRLVRKELPRPLVHVVFQKATFILSERTHPWKVDPHMQPSHARMYAARS
jgi:hypothetical protein